MGTRSRKEREAHWLEAPASFLNVCHPALSSEKRDGLLKRRVGGARKGAQSPEQTAGVPEGASYLGDNQGLAKRSAPEGGRGPLLHLAPGPSSFDRTTRGLARGLVKDFTKCYGL
jgi:hypothetical protein